MSTTDLYERLEAAARAIAEATGRPRHDVVVVLGSASGDFPEHLEEAVALTGYDETTKALHALLDLGCHTALITSDGNGRDEVVNTWMDNNREIHSYHREKLPGIYHGSGCTLSAHLAGRLARGDSVRTAVENAQDYTWQALKNAVRIGKSQLHPGRFCR